MLVFQVGQSEMVKVYPCHFCRRQTDLCIEMVPTTRARTLGSAYVFICPSCRVGLLDVLCVIPVTNIRRIVA